MEDKDGSKNKTAKMIFRTKEFIIYVPLSPSAFKAILRSVKRVKMTGIKSDLSDGNNILSDQKYLNVRLTSKETFIFCIPCVSQKSLDLTKKDNRQTRIF